MAVAGDRALPHESALALEARNRLAGLLLLGVGAILLIVSLFLDWFEPGLSAWTVFEVWDIVLTALALVALTAAAGAFNVGRARPDSWLLAPAVVAAVVVVASLLNHPPAAQGPDQDPAVGIWLALAGALLMLIGAAVSIARISLAIGLPEQEAAARPPISPTPGERVAGGRHGAAEPPVAPTPGPAVPPPGPAAPGAPPPPGAPIGPEQPTDPTRRVIP